MFKISGLLSLAVTFALGAILFWTSQSVQEVERELAMKRAHLAQEQETIRVLSTEWDYLNRPHRLERLAVEGIGMDEVQADQVGIVRDTAEIPEPVMPVLPIVKPASLSRIVPAAGKPERDVSVPYDRGSFEALIDNIEEGAIE